MSKNTFCSHCGLKFAEQKLYPRKCFYCGNDTYANPLPVVVVMATVSWIPEKSGLLIQKRNIPPSKGGWALPSGYINLGETWQQAAARELEEEVYFKVNENDFKLWSVDLSVNTENILIFCTIETQYELYYKSAELFEPNDEVQAVDVISELIDVDYRGTQFKSANAIDVRELAFPTHAKHAKTFLKGNK